MIVNFICCICRYGLGDLFLEPIFALVKVVFSKKEWEHGWNSQNLGKLNRKFMLRIDKLQQAC